MKNKFLKFLATAALVACGSAPFGARAAADIFDIAPCDKDGNAISLPVHSVDKPMINGEKAYFKMRFLWRERPSAGQEARHWKWVYTGMGSTELGNLFAPQIGIYVSGECKYATYCGFRNDLNESLTDIIFEYETSAGDFALPIVLAVDAGGQPKPASDQAASNTGAYYLNPLRSDWTLRFDLEDGKSVAAEWSFIQVVDPARRPTGSVAVVEDYSLAKSGFFVRTIDFSSNWHEEGKVWRTVHEGSTNTDKTPQLVATPQTEQAVTLYVWSTNEEAVVVTGSNVREVEMIDPDDVSNKKTYHVAAITFAKGVPSVDFALKGKSMTANGGKAGLVLSAYDHFNKSDATGDLIIDFISVPVQCIEPLPPSVIVEAEKTIANATSDWLSAANRLTIRTSEPIAEPFTVKLDIKRSDKGEDELLSNWGEYVRFSKTDQYVTTLPDATDDSRTVTLGGGVNEVTLFVFCLRGQSKTESYQLQFKATSTDAPASIVNWGMDGFNVVAQYPEIVSPEEGATIDAVQGEAVPVVIKVADEYADTYSDTGYEIWVTYRVGASGDFGKRRQLEGRYKPGEGGVLYRCDDGSNTLPQLTYIQYDENPYQSQIDVVAPVSGKSSAGEKVVYRTFYASVRKARYSTVSTDSTDYDESDKDSVTVYITLDANGNDSGSTLYAFLRPTVEIEDFSIFDSRSTFILGNVDATGRNKGLAMLANQGKEGVNPVTGKIQFLDGGDGRGEWTELMFDVVFCKSQYWDETKVVQGFEQLAPLDVVIHNVEPTINRIELNGIESEYSGFLYPSQFPKGQEQELVAKINDVRYDLNQTAADKQFQCKWTAKCMVTDPQTGAQTQSGKTYTETTLGSPDTNPWKFNFPIEGRWTVKLQVKDKDMSDWSPSVYEIQVDTLDQPGINLQPSSEFVDETNDKGPDRAYINFGLTYYDPLIPTEGLLVRLTVRPARESANPGKLVLDANTESPNESKWPSAPNTYYLWCKDATPQKILIEEMDGTDASYSTGFIIEATVVSDGKSSDPEKSWAEYYKGMTAKVYPINVAPNNGDLMTTFSPDENSTTNRYEVSGGSATGYPLDWHVRTDVLADLAAGIKVKITGGGGEDYNEDGFVKGEKIVTESTSGRFIPNFGISQGPQQVEITITDKDGASLSRTWYFEVSPAKFLTTAANGPGGTASSALSAHYIGAAGRGEGHVFAENSTFVSASNFRLSWNCASRAVMTVLAWGYKVGAVDDGTLDTADQPISPWGSAQYGVKPTEFYSYPDKELDSFFYVWLNLTKDENGGAEEAILGSVSPERSQSGATVASVSLPTEASESGEYVETVVEAVFAKERYATDNMGDINADGIPDLYFQKYWLVDPETGLALDMSEVNDLKDISVDNADKDKDGGDAPDYLPASLTAPTTAFTGLANDLIEFKAIWEVRGFGMGLNDAPQQSGITGVKPDRVYTNPLTDPKSTLSDVEWLAWQEYATANGLDIASEEAWNAWSPERPTSPILCDTDGDGFADGFEYYFWYRAHVGYIDVNGNHRYMTGRRYDVRNPGEGQLITSAEIEKAMDPLLPGGASALTADSDNDGLPDLIEFTLGTNPFDFDTDGDGLPDGWEIMIAGTDPLKASSYADATLDTDRNSDGDAMAVTSAKLEANVYPTPFFIQKLTTVAVIDSNGDSDGVQWYAVKGAIETEEKDVDMSVFQIGTDWYASAVEPKVVDGRLAGNLAKGQAFVVNKKDDALTRGYPIYLSAGTRVTGEVETKSVKVLTIKLPKDDKGKDKKVAANACWVYGKGGANALKGEVAESAASYGCLAIARDTELPGGKEVCAEPSTERDVAYLHYLVYQEYGFDPRTAWSATDPLASRWGKTEDGETESGIIQIKQGGYTGKPTRTRAYKAYDEFLVHSFFVNNGCNMSGVTYVVDDTAPEWARIWGAFTTNPQGPGDDDNLADFEYKVTTTDGKEVTTKYYGRNDVNGADTDKDGVPDGWELYTMSGPKKDGKFVMAPPYAGFTTSFNGTPGGSYWSPFVAGANKTDTSNQIYLGGQANDDGLNQLREFSGTDSCAYYAKIYANAEAKTILRREEQTGADGTVYTADDSKWLNKFFPTDPWHADTDNDGINDGAEGQTFIYGTPADNGSLLSIPGGGLNPLTVDTDLDGLPDPWEKQYAGTADSLYKGEFVDKAKDADGNEIGNALQGLTDGMDGTVADAYSYPITVQTKQSTTETSTEVDRHITWVVANGFRQVVDRDYDHDGLENWQEYLVGTMRCWRYDDPLSSWTYIPDDKYVYAAQETSPGQTNYIFNAEETAKNFGCADAGEFWYKTLVDKRSDIYNPHFVTGMGAGSQYFSRVDNGWDRAFIDGTLAANRGAGAYYYFYHRIGKDSIADLWVGTADNPGPLLGLVTALGGRTAPTKYISCSPLMADSDQDGMDDYYELFHGMNPLLGESGQILDSNRPCDLVFNAWYKEGFGALEAWGSGLTANYWQNDKAKAAQARGNGYDFEVYPWLNGLATADPDGDDIRNQEESIMPMINPTTVWHHTDPTPVWMTDSSYSNSLTRMFFRLPTQFATVVAQMDNADDATAGSFTYKGKTYYFRDYDGFWPVELESLLGKQMLSTFLPFVPDSWKLAANGAANWIASFEENEGYDSDHDGIGDNDELSGKFRQASEPQDFDSPRRRQAMYFQGDEKPGVLQTMPEIKEQHPVGATIYPDDMAFLQYTVECWVMPEDARDQTIIERAVWGDYSNPGDNELMRKNFQLAIKNGKWYTKFDPSGTLSNKQVEVVGAGDVEIGKWTHLAATYNAQELVLYVNGVAEVPTKSSLQPEYGASAVSVRNEKQSDNVNDQSSFWRKDEYAYKAILVGASAKGQGDGVVDGSALDLTAQKGFGAYKDFFKGYIDEVRIWDGARSADEIKAAMKTRYTAELICQARDDFYDVWSQAGEVDQYRGRYAKDGSGKAYALPAELRYHFAFDSVFGAESDTAVAKAPAGFMAGEKAPVSRPKGYVIPWFSNVLVAYANTVYDNPAWVTWVPNTVAHLPRYDGSTLDSVYWNENFAGLTDGTYKFSRVAEPVSFWTQLTRNQVTRSTDYQTMSEAHLRVNSGGNTNSNHSTLFEFTARHLNQLGDDMLPLGGAYVKYVTNLWDSVENGASDMWEVSGEDTADGLPAWWAEKFGVSGWDDVITKDGAYKGMKAGAAYLLDVHGNGAFYDPAAEDGYGQRDEYRQISDTDGDGMYDWWEEQYGIQGNAVSDGDRDSDNDGLSNYQEFLMAVGGAKAGLSPLFGSTNLNPFAARSFKGQQALDYFLPVSREGDGENGKHFFAGEYLGEVLTDHDFMENWWENQYGLDYTSAHVYDPWDDIDGDGWSTYAECRSYLWCGAYSADLIDRWLDGNIEDNNRFLCYPRPAIGVKVTYEGVRDIAGGTLVVRTMTTGKRVDASFNIHGTDVAITEAQDHMIGSYDKHVRTVHGFLNPGCLIPIDIKLHMAKLASSDYYVWWWYASYKDYIDEKNGILQAGTYADYRMAKRNWAYIRLKDAQIEWGDPVATVKSDVYGRTGEFIWTDNGATVGTINCLTGEYALDMVKILQSNSDAEKCIFKINYSYKIGKNWPQTLWLSDTFDDNWNRDETLTSDHVHGSGRVHEGLNTVEAFIDLNYNGRYDVGEPYGVAKNVQVGWHKVPELTIELTDDSRLLTRMAIVAAKQEGEGGDEEATAEGSSEGTVAVNVRVVRETIGDEPAERTVLSKQFVMDDRAYLTEADVKALDLDWKTLTKDAARLKLASYRYATYRVEQYELNPDGTELKSVIGTFQRDFGEKRPAAAIVSPIDSAPVYSDAPTFRFTVDETATAFSIQVARNDGAIIYDSGVKALGGRSSVTVGNSAYSFTAPIYADVSILTNGAPVLTDSANYQWRVAAYNAKYTKAQEADYSPWQPFQMDVDNKIRYNDLPTGYGRVNVAVRYYGLAKTNDLANLIVVEAFENADFAGQAMAQMRVADLSKLSDTSDILAANANLKGIEPGTVYLRAYIDLNNNGKWDKFESWGYVNMQGEYGPDFQEAPIYNPRAIEVGGAPGDLLNPKTYVLYIEDTDLNKNEIPDCHEMEVFPVVSESDDVDVVDWHSWADSSEDELGYACDGDVMAFAEVEGVLVTVGMEGSDANDVHYLLAKGEKIPKAPVQAMTYALDTCFEYPLADQPTKQLYLRGVRADISSESLWIKQVTPVTVALVHNQVYQEFGYNTLTANPTTPQEQWVAANTKPFTALDKKLVMRYLAAIGAVDAEDLKGLNPNKPFDEAVDELALTNVDAARVLWNKYSLKAGVVDSNGDNIADGWQLYVMFDREGTIAECTPWTNYAAARTVTPGGEGLRWIEEWDGGHYPTDPWAVSTFGDRYVTDRGEFVISDKDAYDYGLKEGDKYTDFDNDGLINYEEYVAQKNDDYALNYKDLFTFADGKTYPELEGQCVPDYFLRSFLSPKYYLGFKVTSHDFLESWWKDQYWMDADGNNAMRKTFDPYGDEDGDGWSNWAEARAGTDPTQVAHAGIEDTTIVDYPVSMIHATLQLPEIAVGNAASIVLKAFNGAVSSAPDAIWKAGATEGASVKEKVISTNPGGEKHYFLNPGSISPNKVVGYLRDQNGRLITETIIGGVSQPPQQTIVDTGWQRFMHDKPRRDDARYGDIVDIYDVVFGSIDYLTGEMVIDYSKMSTVYLQEVSTENNASSEGESATQTRKVQYAWPAYSFFKFSWESSSVVQNSRPEFYLTEADQGFIREGLNTFVAFADTNGNGVYDPGEPFGMAKDVDVGWDKVNNLNIALSTSSSVLPRFKPADIAGSAGTTTDGESSVTVAEGAPIIEDVTADTYVRIVRWTINGEECKHRVVASKKVGADAVVTEADILSEKTLDLDWKQLEQDAKDSFIDLKDVDVIEYAVFVGNVARTEENVNGWIVKKFPHNRANATPVAPTATDTAIVNATRPEFEFKVPGGYAAYAFKLMDATGGVVFCSTELVTAKNADGNVVYQPPVYFGADAEDLVNHLLPTGKYSWSVAMLNAKFRSMEDGWCTPAEFTVQMAKGRVADNDKGFLEVAVRYYGEATVSTNSPIIVQAFKSADFTGVPAGQTVIYDGMGVTNIYTNTNSVNAKIFGLTPGDYYVRAFIDTTNDVKRSTWESWGYQNNVGTGKKDLYTPVSTKVVRNDTSFALVFIEDMDVNNNMKPDCIEGLSADDEHNRKGEGDGIDSDGDGTPDEEEEGETGTDPYDWDTDGDGMPDGWEEWAGTDPLDPDGDYAVPGDVMAYEEVEMWLITTEDGTQLLLKEGEIVPNPGDTLAGYGEVFYVPYEYGDVYGRGQQVSAPNGAMVNRSGNNPPKKVKVALVHDQVYERHGFDPNTAVPGGSVNTKEFTALDKYLVLRYREMMGSNYWTDVHFELPEGYDDIEDYVNQNKLWADWTLKPGNPDTDVQPQGGIGDGIYDGWELYTHNNPWNYFDRASDNDEDGVTLVDEYDFDPETGTAHPTDPMNPDSDGDGVGDADYHKWLLYDPAGDKDGDGLSNYAEYLITEVFQFAKLDPRNPKTDGACVDYFRKVGDLYLGEVFTDHDQVNDVWEGHFHDEANRYVYDPNRDDDGDGWSNYAEFRANTDPGIEADLEITDAEGVTYAKAEYPIPVVEAKVVYNGKDVALGNIVFKAWNEKADPDMTSAPDAIWTFSTIPAGVGEKTLAVAAPEKYIGVKPAGVERYLLSGGSVGSGSVTIKVLSKHYTRTGLDVIAATTNETASAEGAASTNSTEKAKIVTKAGDPSKAPWYLAAHDIGGKIVTLAGTEIGTINYNTGIVDIDFSKLTGMTVADIAGKEAFASPDDWEDIRSGYDAFEFEGSFVKIGWASAMAGTSPAGTYYLADADAVSATAKSHGHVREGKNTFVCYLSDSDAYAPGMPLGVIRGVEIGWQGTSFTIEITETSAITPRISLWSDTDDRSVTIDDINTIMLNDRTIANAVPRTEDYDLQVAALRDIVSNRVQKAKLEPGKDTRIRVVRYGIDDMFAYMAGVYESGVGIGFDQKVVLDRTFHQDGRDFLCEADFLSEDELDIDWNTLSDPTSSSDGFRRNYVVDADGMPLGKTAERQEQGAGPAGAGLKVTNMTYLVVIGDGAKDFRGSLDSNTVVRALATTINRRFELNRSKPVALPMGIVYGAHPTFKWSMPNEEPWACEFGSSYTAFKVQVLDTLGSVIYDSGVRRAPKQDAEGNFVWTASVSAGDQTSLGKVLGRAGDYRWRVVMYNAKFKPQRLDGNELYWSDEKSFSVAVGQQQAVDDHNYSSVAVAVKYAGPELVLSNCTDTATTKGMVRVQAFTSADFSGEPLSQAFITNKVALTNTSDISANCTLYGLPVEGTYYIRAYIDSNGNFKKDDWESWGYAKTSVKLERNKAQPVVGLYIEDADTDQDWLPDAWEYVKRGNLDTEAASVDPEGKIVLKKTLLTSIKGGKANISDTLSGASLTFFENLGNAALLLGLGDVTYDTIAAIRAAVQKNVDKNTVKITSFVVDPTAGTVILNVGAQTTDSIGGTMLAPLYVISPATTVTIKVYRKDNLLVKGWGEPIETKTVSVTSSILDEKITIKLSSDLSSGFYAVEVVQ